MKPSIHPFLNILPGQTCAQVQTRFDDGPMIDRFGEGNTISAMRGDVAGISVVAYFRTDCKTGLVEYTTDGPTAMTTPDGIILGRDTLATICKRLHVRLESLPFEAATTPDGTQSYTTGVSVTKPPHANFPFYTSYDITIDSKRADRLPARAGIHDLANDIVVNYSLYPQSEGH